MFEGVIANVAMVTFFKSPLRPKAPTARVQTWLKMFLIQCTLRQSWSAKFPLGGNKRVSGSGTILLIADSILEIYLLCVVSENYITLDKSFSHIYM